MSEIKHAPGTFCWAELMTTDSSAAKTFYGGLFGWETHDDPIPGGGVYTMISLAGGNVAGMFELSDEMKQEGVPPHWHTYVSVEDADATAARAGELGGTVVKEPFDVMDIGRMATIQDPSKATLSVWQAKKHHGFGHTEPRPGTVAWNELMSDNVDAAGTFYASLFSWSPDVKDMGNNMTYTIFARGEAQLAGMMSIQGEEKWKGMPSMWAIYFHVDNCDHSVEKAKELGGTIVVPPTDIPNIGRFALFQDPTGIIFSIIAPPQGA